MILYVQEKFPNNYKELNAKELETKIEQLIKQADSYCLKTRNYVKLFIAYSCQYKWDGIIGNEEIRSIFLNREYSAKEKFIIVNQILENN